MAAPITWRSLADGANFGNTAADFEGINDALSGAMQNFKQAGQSISDDRQAVYDNGQANMQEQFQTLLANNKHEQARNFLTEGGGGFDLRNKSSLIPTIDADIKSDLKKTRADSLATYNFSEAERNQREAPILAAARSRIQNGTATLDGLSGLDIQDTSGLTKSFNDKTKADDVFNRKEKSRLENKSIEQVSLEVAQKAGSPAEARAGAISRGKELGLSEGAILKLATAASDSFNSVNGLTADQRANLDGGAQTTMENYNRDKLIRQRELETAINSAPVDDYFSFGDPNRMSQAAGLEQVLAKAPQNVTDQEDYGAGGEEMIENIKENVLPEIRTALGIGKNDEVPGSVISLAVRDLGTTEEFFGTDQQLNVNNLRTNMLAAAREYMKSQKNYDIRLGLQNNFDTEDQTNYEKASSFYSTELNKLRDFNKSLSNIRGK